jgi:hypothetical protein
MAAFCANCGAPLVPGAKFCEKCGTAAENQSFMPATPAPAISSPANPATTSVISAPVSQGSSTGVKVIFVVLGIFVLLALLVGGSCVYIGYRMKQRAHEYSKNLGGDVAPYTGERVPCAMLSATEATAALGQPVSSFAQLGMSTCEYRFGAGGQRRVDVEYTWEGGAIGLGLARAAMKQISGMETFRAIPGIGDEAYVAPGGSGVLMRKGDVMVHIDLRASSVTVDQAEAMARGIASHL